MTWNRSKTPCSRFDRIVCWFECARPKLSYCSCYSYLLQSHCRIVHVIYIVHVCCSVFKAILCLQIVVIKASCRIEEIHRMQICFPPQLPLTAYPESIIVDLPCASQALVIKYPSSTHVLIIVSCYSTFVAMLFRSAIHCIHSLRKSIASTADVSSILSSWHPF